MALDLGDSDWMVEIAPNGGRRTDRELSHVLKGFGICLTAAVEKERIHDVTEEMNRRSMLAPFRGGQVATP